MWGDFAMEHYRWVFGKEHGAAGSKNRHTAFGEGAKVLVWVVDHNNPIELTETARRLALFDFFAGVAIPLA